MDSTTMHDLSFGDIIQHTSSGSQLETVFGTFIVSANYGNRVTAVTTVDVTNPSEWELIAKAIYKGGGEE